MKITSVFLALFLYALPVQAADSLLPTSPALGTYDGSGRACGGKLLRITRNTLRWTAPFSTCASSPYRILEQQQDDQKIHLVFELLKPSKNCPFRVFTLDYSGEFFWSVDAFTSLAAYQQNETQSGQSCQIYK